MQLRILNGAADLGYGWVKAVIDGRAWRQPSVVGEPSRLFEESIRPTDVQYNNEYFIGGLALRHSSVKYAGTKESKAETWTTEVLLKAALGVLAPQAAVNLVTGLPIDYFFNQREEMAQLLESLRFTERFDLTIGAETFNAWPKVRKYKLVPQPMGSAMDYLLNTDGQLADKNEARKQLLVVDLGYFTLDLLALDAMEIGKESCSPPGLGVSTAYKLLQGYLKEKVGKAPALYELDRYVIAGEYEGYNIQPLIQKAFKALAESIQLEIESLNTNYSRYIITGGAANLIAPYLDLRNKIILNDPQLGNARGYEKIAARAWRL